MHQIGSPSVVLECGLGLAIVPLCRGEHRLRLAPSKFFDVCVTVKKFYYRCGPLPSPLVVMITKLSLIGIISNNGNNFS